jgi:hypothetical protein
MYQMFFHHAITSCPTSYSTLYFELRKQCSLKCKTIFCMAICTSPAEHALRPSPTNRIYERAQMGRRETERERGKKAAGEREFEIPRPSCLSRAQVRCACSRGLQASTREGSERPHASACPVLFPARPTLCKRALVLPFIGVRRGSRCTMGV